MGESDREPTVVGWREFVDLPAWGIRGVRAKIDTGARTSAMHVAEIQEIDEDHIRFLVVYRERPARKTQWVEAELIRQAVVKPSSGRSQERPVVRTIIRIGDRDHEIEMSLVNRKGMLCRMLVGRKALEGSFVVDPGRTHVADGHGPRRTYKRTALSRNPSSDAPKGAIES